MDYKAELQKLINNGTKLFLDTSYANGKINFPYMKSKYPWIDTVIIKVSESTGIDNQFVNSLTSLRETDIKIAAYTMFHQDQDYKPQMAAFNKFCSDNEFCPEFIGIDFELAHSNNIQGIAANLTNYYKDMETQWGVPVLIYSYYGYISPFSTYLPADMKIFMANYSDMNPDNGHLKVVARQFSGYIPDKGCSGFLQPGWRICKDTSHQHGLLFEVNPGQLIPIDVSEKVSDI